MRPIKNRLLSSTVIPAFIFAGVAIGGSVAATSPAGAAQQKSNTLPPAKPRPRTIELAAACNPCNPCAAKKACGACNPCNPCAAKKACNPCNPCAAKKACGACNPCNPYAAKKACNPCNPCAAKNPCSPCNPCAAKKACNPCNPCAAKNPCSPCNPCAAKKACNPCNPCAAKNPCSPCNPCNPCGAGNAAAVSKKCQIPRLTAAWAKSPCNPCSPCAPKKVCNPCNPCAAKKACNPCNPCAAKKACNPCNPCAAKNPCSPCNPCNPCGASAEAPEISNAEAQAVYNCLKPEMVHAYSKAGVSQVSGYTKWVNVAATPYPSGTHGGRFVNNYTDAHGDYRYKKFEKAGVMPQGSTLAKDSFVVRPDGRVSVGPLFVMEKMGKGWRKSTGDWRYTMIMPNGKVAGQTGTKGMNMKFCAECHSSVAPEQDNVMFLPEEFRKTF